MATFLDLLVLTGIVVLLTAIAGFVVLQFLGGAAR
jgi:hypothetical protein